MGNSLGVVVDNYIGSVPYPCHLQLGPSTSIDLSRNLPEPPENDLFMENETWSVTYRVEKKRCRVQLIRYIDFVLVSYVLSDSLSGTTNVTIDMEIIDSNYIRIYPTSWSTETDSILWTKRNTSFDAWGAVKETQVDLYGSGGRWGLLAVESKRNKKEQEAEVVTVMHYIVKSSGTPFYRSTGTDIGLSVVAKFRISNGKFQITGEGLEQHPVSSLLYMFDEVKRTGIWKPTMCPHCDHKRKGKMFWQSDSEDSDSVSMPLLPATLRNSRGVSNGGRFRGNGNGNIYEGNVMVYKR
ncbi:hypothetical protein LR48_Vigan10g011000 [Vigna angularis]|uniref:Uncharacterized protein n=1 Tax=Phaseolus angularis TaxID=3914 RepID=A0A0L9VGV9_PHAAN|nr:hypothetical protein LR48_Vigan10g011000 [Vigna angularis]